MAGGGASVGLAADRSGNHMRRWTGAGPWRWAPPVVAWALALGLSQADAMSRPVAAQVLRGQLLDVTTDAPLPLGSLSLLAADRSEVATTSSNPRGFWELVAPGPGTYYVRASRAGYQEWTTGPVELARGEHYTAVFHLRADPVRLDPVEASARITRDYLGMRGFFARQRSSFGHFLTQADIDRRDAARITDLLVAIPGVQRAAAMDGSVGPAQILLRGSSMSQGGYCRPRVFVDGLVYSRGAGKLVRLGEAQATERADEDITERMDLALSIDDIGHPSTIAGIEIYRTAAQVPVEFGGGSVETLCGVIVVWTRTGRS
jgi:hypothetical protein